jgi:hypothetical protein
MLLLLSFGRLNNPLGRITMYLSNTSAGHTFSTTFLYIISFVAILISSCSQNSNESKNNIPSADSTIIFYPVREYFLSQIKSVDSSLSTIQMVTTINGQKKSAPINIEQFNKMAQPFLENNIADPSVKKYYRQSIFQDMTTGSYTFNYTSVNSSLPIQNLNVLLDTTTQTVKRVFISKVKIYGDSTITEKLSWKNDTSFLINRTIELPQKKKTEQISVVWHNSK